MHSCCDDSAALSAQSEVNMKGDNDDAQFERSLVDSISAACAASHYLPQHGATHIARGVDGGRSWTPT